MQALEVVMGLLDKNIVEKITEKTRRGPKGYKLLLRLRLLLYAVLIEVFETKNLLRHFEKKSFALTAVLAIQALAIYNLKKFGYPSIRIAELRI